LTGKPAKPTKIAPRRGEGEESPDRKHVTTILRQGGAPPELITTRGVERVARQKPKEKDQTKVGTGEKK